MKSMNTISSIKSEFYRAYNAAINREPIDLMSMTASEITVFMNFVQSARNAAIDAHLECRIPYSLCQERLYAIDRLLSELAKQYS